MAVIPSKTLFQPLRQWGSVLRPWLRHASVSVATEGDGVATLSMNKAPVNSLNTELIQELNQAVIDTQQTAKAIVLTSGCSVFCAGLDITEMYQPDITRLKLFWGSLQDLWISIYGCKVPMVAAINGHSPAGGCLLALSCDYRAMVGPNKTIGLNETQLGIVAPFWFADTLINTVGRRHAELALMQGTLFTSEQALAIGLVDEVVTDKEAAVASGHRVASSLAGIPTEARHLSKLMMRGPTLDKLTRDKQADIENFVSFVTKPQVQKPMGMYLEALKKKSKKT